MSQEIQTVTQDTQVTQDTHFASHVQSSIEEVSSIKRKIHITVSVEKVVESFKKVESEFQQHKEVKGFRKGKAPLALLKRVFYPEMAEKAMQEVVHEGYNQALKTVDFQIIGRPELEAKGEFSEKKPFQFTISVEINPQLEIKDYTAISLKAPAHLRPEFEKEVEQDLEKISEAHGTKSEVSRPAKVTDEVLVDYSIFLEGETAPYKEAEEQTLNLKQMLSDFQNGLVGMNSGEEKSFSVTFPLKYHDDKLSGQTCRFEVKLHKITENIPALLDDELAKKEGLQTFEELKERTLKSIKQNHSFLVARAVADEITEHLLLKNDFEIPAVLIQDVQENMAHQMMEQLHRTKADLPALRQMCAKDAEKEAKKMLALANIARQEMIQVDDQEIIQHLTQILQQNPWLAKQLLDRQAAQNAFSEMKSQILIQKVLVHIVDKANVEYVEPDQKDDSQS